jgi:uncharacterized membrane protein YjjP (DUF1212 family)
MHTAEQLSAIAIEHTKEIARLWESAKSAHKRIDENDQITAGIHELAKNVATMATEIKLLTDRMDKSIERIEQGQKTQGERIGNIERVLLAIDRDEKTLEQHETRLDAIEKEPATAWKNLKWVIVVAIATAIVGFFMGKFL